MNRQNRHAGRHFPLICAVAGGSFSPGMALPAPNGVVPLCPPRCPATARMAGTVRRKEDR
ncbi:MAG: hypothetical protein IJR87_11440 [Bacteroidaceae bacterium]|nr:hypothetical protein [Bacteroidaceae bacterium]